MTDNVNSTGSFVSDLGDAARQNPVSAALIGMGVLWLFTGGARRLGFDGLAAANDTVARGRSAMRSGLDSVGGVASDLADRVSQTAKRTGTASGEAINAATDTVRGGAGEAYEQTARAASQFAGSATDAFGTARANLANMFHDQPLLLGAVGLAIGAGIAASFPSTELEAEYLGETSDQLKDNAQEFASRQTDRAKTVAQNAVRAATEEARRQGLDPDGLKAAANDIGDRVRTIVGAATDTVKGRVEQRS
jgi:hypothetical protein